MTINYITLQNKEITIESAEKTWLVKKAMEGKTIEQIETMLGNKTRIQIAKVAKEVGVDVPAACYSKNEQISILWHSTEEILKAVKTGKGVKMEASPKKAAEITNVKMEVVGTWTVRYASGAIRNYADGKLPKTAQAWLAENPRFQEAADMAMKWNQECEDDLALYRALKGKGQGSGKPYEAELKKRRKAIVIFIAEGAGMSTVGYVTKKSALAWLLAA